VITSASVIELLRNLSFGGLLFAGLGAIASYRWPWLTQGHPYIFMLACGLVGAALERAIAKAVSVVLGPVGRVLTFYENLVELGALKTRGAIDDNAHKELVQKLCEKRFIK
jgi:hypothetical protein